MLCVGCGAAYEDKMFNCPYCGKENERMTVARQNEELGKIYSQINDVVMEPERRANKMAGKLVIIAVALLVLVVVVIVIGVLVSKPLSDKKIEKQQDNLAKLEQMYDIKDYSGMEKLLDSMGDDAYSGTYYKYRDVVDIIDDIKYCEKEVEKLNIEGETEEYVVSNLNFDFYFLFVALDDIEDFEETGYGKRETEFIQENRDKVYKMFTDTYKITKEEVVEWAELGKRDSEEYEELSKLSYGRMINRN